MNQIVLQAPLLIPLCENQAYREFSCNTLIHVTETLVRQDPRLIFVVGLAIVAELAAAIFLIERQNANFALAKDMPAKNMAAPPLR